MGLCKVLKMPQWNLSNRRSCFGTWAFDRCVPG